MPLLIYGRTRVQRDWDVPSRFVAEKVLCHPDVHRWIVVCCSSAHYSRYRGNRHNAVPVSGVPESLFPEWCCLLLLAAGRISYQKVQERFLSEYQCGPVMGRIFCSDTSAPVRDCKHMLWSDDYSIRTDMDSWMRWASDWLDNWWCSLYERWLSAGLQVVGAILPALLC